MNNINCVTDQKNKCFGCRACFNICPTKAIIMQEDEEGFFYPVVDNEKCTNCGLCKKTCPSLNKSEVYEHNSKNPDCYAVMANDEIRAVSSSGGAFTLIANEIFKQGGVVCGVAYVGRKVQHIIIDNPKDMYKLRGSKYVQSDTNTVYSQIKDILKTGRKVLFTGTPCQVAGLYSFLGKDYDNLLTLDLFCHGVPPQKVFDMYIKEETEGEFLNTDFRDKRSGWDVYTTTTTTKGVYSYTKSQCLFLNAFLKNMCLRPSCATCPYTSTQREADITIGDFWAVERYDKILNDRFGTSAVLLNSEKAKKLEVALKQSANVFVKVPVEYASWYNVTLYKPLKQHPNRKAFFRLLKQGNTLRETTDYCLKNKYDCATMGVWYAQNYGSLLTAFSLQEAIKSLGYSVKTINFISPKSSVNFENSLSDKFSKQYLNLTERYSSYAELRKLNNNVKTFITGSDCLWHPPFYNYNSKDYINFLSFASPKAKKIAYSTSFGTYDYPYTDEEIYKMKYYLEQFDNISTRETQGIEFCKKRFDIDVSQCIDPVFLIDKNNFMGMIEKSQVDITNKYIATYIFEPNIKIYKMVNYIKDKLNLPVIDIEDKTKINVEDWLKYIKNCDLLITHSFHGLCFALIFNKPFILYRVSGFDDSRYSSLLKQLGLENRLLVDVSSIENRPDLFEPIDWDNVNTIIKKEAERSINWLKDALEAPKDLSKVNPADAMIQSLNNRLLSLEASMISIEDYYNLKHYKKIYFKYLKYKILKNFVSGSTRERYKNKQKIYHEKVRKVRNIKRGILNV